MFTSGIQPHIHPSEPGAATCSAITAAIKNIAVDDVLQPAGEIVR